VSDYPATKCYKCVFSGTGFCHYPLGQCHYVHKSKLKNKKKIKKERTSD